MPDGPSPSEAARALHEVDRRKDQAVGSMRRARWVDIVFGVAIFATLAAHDFLGADAGAVAGIVVAVLAVSYNWLGRTRRGAAILGQPTRVRRDAISPRFSIPAVTVLLAALLVGFLFPLLGLHPLAGVPYWHTILGAVLGLALILFGRQLQTGMNFLARGGHRNESGMPDGQR
jgi:membrane associated rhomboid family serine protease